MAEEAFPFALVPGVAREAPVLLPEEAAAQIAAAYHAAAAGEGPAPLGAALAAPPILRQERLQRDENAAARRMIRSTLEALRVPAQASLDPALARAFLRGER